jgi:hypothetical protein
LQAKQPLILQEKTAAKGHSFKNSKITATPEKAPGWHCDDPKRQHTSLASMLCTPHAHPTSRTHRSHPIKKLTGTLPLGTSNCCSVKSTSASAARPVEKLGP